MQTGARSPQPSEIPSDTTTPSPAEPMAPTVEAPLRGPAAILAALKTFPRTPGVYRMIGAEGEALYIGKARNLWKRVTAYTRPERMEERLAQMIRAVARVEIISTHTEVEALLLESNLIKREKPRYNVLLRDDKSFPYILLTGDHAWPQLLKHRGSRGRKGEYFGPFASAGAVNQTLAVLQRAFPLRSCSDTYFATRTRPCLQYQIKRCTAPCVGRIGAEPYGAIVKEAREFLAGKSRDLQQRLAERMEAASNALDFEAAAVYRDRIRALNHIQQHQDINVLSLGDSDVIAVYCNAGQVCMQVFFFRGGHNFGNRTYFPVHTAGLAEAEIMESFLGQFYADKMPPPRILLSHLPPSHALIAEALSVRADRNVELTAPQRGVKRNLVDNALQNAQEALARRLSENAAQRRLLEGMAEAFGLDGAPERIEVYDNSHISGTDAVGAMIVAGPDGLQKNAYRRFNIKGTDLTPGDDYAMMREVLGRRFARALKEDPDRQRGGWPDLVIVDGGLGQVSAAIETLAGLGIDDIPILGVAKGPDRDAGRERFHLPVKEPFMLRPGDPVLYFIQRLRDEAHRFAIGAHRAKRSRAIARSELDEVPGVGALRKRALLHHFGSAKAVAQAGLADLEAVAGINRAVAKKIYDHFRAEG